MTVCSRHYMIMVLHLTEFHNYFEEIVLDYVAAFSALLQ